MRDIYLRAWDFTCKEMIYGVLTNGSTHVMVNKDIKGCEMSDWMLSTSLKDKNGETIYDGDILEITNNDPSSSNYNMSEGRHRVYFENGGFMIEWELYRGGKTGTDIRVRNNNSEVIGNVYKNPELLLKEVNMNG